jgi:hypothetical protein
MNAEGEYKEARHCIQIFNQLNSSQSEHLCPYPHPSSYISYALNRSLSIGITNIGVQGGTGLEEALTTLAIEVRELD